MDVSASPPTAALAAPASHPSDSATAPALPEEPALLEDEDAERLFAEVLPDGWTLIGRCRTGMAQAGDQGGCYVLAHAEVGVALVDLAPGTTPDAELRLRRMLNLVDFGAECRGYLPIVHCRVGAAEVGGLGRDLDAAFSCEPRLGIGRRTPWVAALRRVFRSGAAWEAIGQARPILPGRPGEGSAGRPRPGALVRGGLRTLALGATFMLGLGAGILWYPPASSDDRSQEMATTGMPPMVPGAGVLGAGPALPADRPLGGPVLREDAAARAALGVPASAPLPPVSFPTGPLPPESLRQEPLPAVAAPVPLPEPPGPGLTGIGGPVDTGVSGRNGAVPGLQIASGAGLAGALSQPVATEAATGTAAPAARRVREPLPIDRRCSEAVFRYQQGATLTQGEMSYVRRGCASWR